MVTDIPIKAAIAPIKLDISTTLFGVTFIKNSINVTAEIATANIDNQNVKSRLKLSFILNHFFVQLKQTLKTLLI